MFKLCKVTENHFTQNILKQFITKIYKLWFATKFSETQSLMYRISKKKVLKSKMIHRYYSIRFADIFRETHAMREINGKYLYNGHRPHRPKFRDFDRNLAITFSLFFFFFWWPGLCSQRLFWGPLVCWRFYERPGPSNSSTGKNYISSDHGYRVAIKISVQ